MSMKDDYEGERKQKRKKRGEKNKKAERKSD